MLDTFNSDIERRAAKFNGDYMQAMIDYQEEHPTMDFYDMKEQLDPIVLHKVQLTAYQHNHFRDKKVAKSLDDIFK
jgi:hypothetical protein